MFALVGLGNPGAEYAETRHNAGFWVLDAWATKHRDSLSGNSWTDGKGCSYLKTKILGRDVLLLKPLRFMNRSGEAALPVLRFFKAAIEDTLVIYDELDIPAGIARMKRGGSSGGHRGVADFAKIAGSDDFLRLRIGVGHPRDAKGNQGEESKRPPVDVPDWLLKKPAGEDVALIRKAVGVATDAVDWWLSSGFQAAQQKLHSVSRIDVPKPEAPKTEPKKPPTKPLPE